MNKVEQKKNELDVLEDLFNKIDYIMQNCTEEIDDYKNRLAEIDDANLRENSVYNKYLSDYTCKLQYAKKILTLLEKEI
jgi:hypothetical protein